MGGGLLSFFLTATNSNQRFRLLSFQTPPWSLKNGQTFIYLPLFSQTLPAPSLYSFIFNGTLNWNNRSEMTDKPSMVVETGVKRSSRLRFLRCFTAVDEDSCIPILEEDAEKETDGGRVERLSDLRLSTAVTTRQKKCFLIFSGVLKSVFPDSSRVSFLFCCTFTTFVWILVSYIYI